MIWPDNDEPGHKYARCVAELCYEAGAASVKIVEVSDAVFARSWDLADPLPVGIDIVRMTAEATAADRRPGGREAPNTQLAELPDIATGKVTEYRVADLYNLRHQHDIISDALSGRWMYFDPTKGWRKGGAFSAAKRLVEEIVSANSMTSTRSLESLGFTKRFMQIAAEEGLRKDIAWDQSPGLAGAGGRSCA